MKKLLSVCVLFLVSTSLPVTQTNLTGRWRAVILPPIGPSQEFTLDLKSDGTTVSGSVLGATIKEGRIDGNTISLKVANPGNPSQEGTLTGQLSGDEIVFKVVGLLPGPVQFVARRTWGAILSAASRTPLSLQSF